MVKTKTPTVLKYCTAFFLFLMGPVHVRNFLVSVVLKREHQYKAYQQCDVKYAVPKLVLDQTFQASTVTDSSRLFCKALLLTFGCDAVFPYMAYEALRVLASEGKFLVSDSKGAHKWRFWMEFLGVENSFTSDPPYGAQNPRIFETL